jgi:hypothetical protein
MVQHQRRAITPLQQAFWGFAFSDESTPFRQLN